MFHIYMMTAFQSSTGGTESVFLSADDVLFLHLSRDRTHQTMHFTLHCQLYKMCNIQKEFSQNKMMHVISHSALQCIKSLVCTTYPLYE